MTAVDTPVPGAAEASPDVVDAAAVRLFADPLRLRIVQLLAGEQLCTCHLVAATGAKQPTVSHHLRILRDAGVVGTHKVGSFTYYELRSDVLLHLGSALLGLGHRAEQASRRRQPC
ncbi:MAG TPA: metalloregulator ArsR/SmtB family transcription factor [Euzebya sp.]|nr:metalloregulator ArsR/SmtB family transcription factor [Euzebya sp.]